MMSQSVIAGVDSLIVAPLGVVAIAAVGLSGFVFAVLTSGLIGLMVSTQAAVGRALGANRPADAVATLHASLVIGLAGGMLLIMTVPILPSVVGYLTESKSLAANCQEYLSVLILSSPAVGVIRAYRGFLGGVQKNSLSLAIIILVYTSNVLISIVLVSIGYGIKGAAIGTSVSFYIGASACVLCQKYIGEEYKIWTSSNYRKNLKPLLIQTFFSGVQQCFFSGVFAAMFVIAGYISSEALAVVTVLNNILVFLITPLIGLGLSSTTFVGISLGSGSKSLARAWVNTALCLGAVLYVVQLPTVFASNEILFLFLREEELASQYSPLLMIAILAVFSEIFGQILKFSLFGAGESRNVAVVTTLLQWGLFVPGAYIACTIFSNGVETLWGAFLTYRALEAAIIAFMWSRQTINFASTENSNQLESVDISEGVR